jgi:hypothetical protein
MSREIDSEAEFAAALTKAAETDPVAEWTQRYIQAESALLEECSAFADAVLDEQDEQEWIARMDRVKEAYPALFDRMMEYCFELTNMRRFFKDELDDLRQRGVPE